MLLLEDKIAKAVSLLSIPENFGGFLEDSDYPEVYDIDCYLGQEMPGTAAYHGVSKCVIVIPESEYVIKIPFNGYWETDEYWDEEDEEWYKSDSEEFIPFCGANYDINCEDASDWDYCENELIKYENAVDAGMEEFFAKITFYDYVNNYPIYLQEKVKEYSWNNYVYSEEAEKTYNSNKELQFRLPRQWAILAIDWYGEERYKEFLQYIKDNDINDLHSGNVGFAANGRPVILDYAGWNH